MVPLVCQPGLVEYVESPRIDQVTADPREVCQPGLVESVESPRIDQVTADLREV